MLLKSKSIVPLFTGNVKNVDKFSWGKSVREQQSLAALLQK
ncbi:hypothetical protein KP78_28910 [Jeotgalibacillus soli]|uniref:Uncharacterized protein n=1 Tax=Jeotgalibacillus soli TaxID=889306 RepID=A0A0C2V8Q8_9BACL|nr:hypothetical protein KP78_28910 [Jeotgalibacillus soli]